MNKEEILNKYIDLIDKGYCSDCNELNCIDNFPHTKITRAIIKLQQENKKYKEVIDKTNWENQLLKKENKQLKDNWNKLKEYCKENTLCYEVGDDENTKLIGSKIHGLNVLDKMQELEKVESDK